MATEELVYSDHRDGTFIEVYCSKDTYKVGLMVIPWPKLLKSVIWSNHKSNRINPTQIQIKSKVPNQIFLLKSNHRL